MSVYPLICKSQNYAWGKKGRSSYVSKFLNEFDDEEKYAELWMGVHPNGESSVQVEEGKVSVPLAKFLKDRNHPPLSFLFKILSIAEPLSIQLHPTKEFAEVLHKNNPQQYKDDNHKPECAIALTDFEAMCGFRLYGEIRKHIGEIPELKSLFMHGETDESFLNLESPEDLKRLFHKLLNCDRKYVKECIDKTLERITKTNEDDKTREEVLFQKLFRKYPSDPCCFCPWIFNYFQLKPGQSLFINPCIPHSYVSGDIIECMANSDNVIRCGLTPKFIDQENLLKITDFSEIDPSSHELEGIQKVFPGDTKVTDFISRSFEEFQVCKIDVKGEYMKIPQSIKNNTIALVVSGEGQIREDVKAKEGDVFLLENTCKVKFESSEGMTVFLARSK